MSSSGLLVAARRLVRTRVPCKEVGLLRRSVRLKCIGVSMHVRGALALQASTLVVVVDVCALSEVPLSNVYRHPDAVHYLRVNIVAIVSGSEPSRERVDPVDVPFPARPFPCRGFSIGDATPPFVPR